MLRNRYYAFALLLLANFVYAKVYEINGSPFSTQGAPMPEYIHAKEKTIVVYPADHVWGAYGANGKLIRWGIATAGAHQCRDGDATCLTKIGTFRIFSLGNNNCSSNKYDHAPMPYCMYFTGGQALHGSSNIEFANISHGCVRLHIDDAKWLRFHFVQGPSLNNNYQGTKVIIKPY